MSVDPTREAPGNGAAGMKWPLIGSAAGHLALLAFLLMLRAAAGPSFPGSVQVLLVEGDRATVISEKQPGTGVPGYEKDSSGNRAETGPVFPPASDPEHSRPAPFAAAEGGAPTVSNLSPAASLPLPARIALEKSSPGHPGGERLDGAAPTEGAWIGKGSNTVTSGPTGGAKGAPLTPPGVAGVSGGGDGPEIRLLRERIESRIVYPEEAIRRGQEGEVLLRIRVGEGGIPGDIRIARSSGARVLDEAARNGVVRAAPLPSLPGWFEVPVRFFLR